MRKKVIIKNLLFVFFSFFITFNSLKSEDCISNDETQPCCNGTISTDPRLNTQSIPYANNPGRSEMVNKFNWMLEMFDVYHECPGGGYTLSGGPYNINNPFYTQAEYLSHINFYDHIYPYEFDKLDLWPEDGWELLHKNNGYDVNELNLLQGLDRRKGPYFILYNKYSGVLRLFAALPVQLVGINQVITDIKLIQPNQNYQYSSILSNQNNISQPLDQYTSIYRISSSSAAPIFGDFWTTDFYMAYDPCVCHNLSKLHFKFKIIDEAQLTLAGRLIATSMPLDNSGNAPLLNGRDFLASVYRDDYNIAQAGILTYKNIDDLVEKYKQPEMSWIEEFGLNALKAVIQGTTAAADGILNSALGGPYNAALVSSGIAGYLDTSKQQTLGFGIFSSANDQIYAALTNDPRKSVPNIGIIEGEMALSGTYVNEDDMPGDGIDFKLSVPGSKDTEDPNIVPWQEYPTYNEALGVFALLETPKLKRYTLSGQGGFNAYSYFWSINYKLDRNSIKYYFNPSTDIDLEKTKISASIFIPQRDISNPYYFYHTKLVKAYPVKDMENYSYYNSAFYPISCLDKIRLNFLQICDVLAGCNNINTQMVPFDNTSIPTPQIKFLIYCVFKPNIYGKVKKQLLQFTYPMEIIETQDNLEENSIETPFILNLSNNNYTTNTLISAWNNIIIEGNLTADPGVNVEIVAGNEIIVKPGASVSPNITLRIELPSECEPLPPVTPQYVNCFCNSENYKAKQLNPSIINSFKKRYEEQEAKLKKIKNDALLISPNPFSSSTTITITLPEADNVNLAVFDMLGRKIYEFANSTFLSAGEHRFTLESQNLESGMFYVNFATKNNYISKSLILVK